MCLLENSVKPSSSDKIRFFYLWKKIFFSIAFSSVQNGEVFVFTGMLQTVLDLHQLAIIIGHEMAHAVLAHSVSASLLTGLCCSFRATFSRQRQRLATTPRQRFCGTKTFTDVQQQSLDQGGMSSSRRARARIVQRAN